MNGAEFSWPWLLFWLFAFAGLGSVIGWSLKGLMVEQREYRDGGEGGT